MIKMKEKVYVVQWQAARTAGRLYTDLKVKRGFK